jgi:hypothetical protein
MAASVKLRVSAKFRKYRIWLNSMLSKPFPSRPISLRPAPALVQRLIVSFRKTMGECLDVLDCGRNCTIVAPDRVSDAE